MMHMVVLAASNNVEAAGLILRGIKGVFVAVGSIVAAIICGLVAAMKGRNPLGWGIAGLFFSILTLIVVIVVPRKRS
ncbi:deoxyribodipyrimidine photolyase [Mycobacterium sp. NPDC048908]|uniref:deoxyribodipyrimidine photolyase n=1 Tax=Mycobacterium sp. NPDC048908 TaxID=3364292 RepID=UPI003718FDF4